MLGQACPIGNRSKETCRVMATVMPDLPTLERKLKGVRQEVRNLQVMQMRPDQSAEKLKLLADLERSARAEVKLRLKAIEHVKQRGK
jgi:hypothetical protein